MNTAPTVWPDATAADCPFPRSTRIKAEVKLTGHSAVVPGSGADTWYPSWASDGKLYSTFADGTVNGVAVQGYQGADSQRTGHALITGDDPTALKIDVLGTFRTIPGPMRAVIPRRVWFTTAFRITEPIRSTISAVPAETGAGRARSLAFVSRPTEARPGSIPSTRPPTRSSESQARTVGR